MCEEIFGPILTVYVYPSNQYQETLELCYQTSPYGLTDSIFAKDRQAIRLADKILRHSVGNFTSMINLLERLWHDNPLVVHVCLEQMIKLAVG